MEVCSFFLYLYIYHRLLQYNKQNSNIQNKTPRIIQRALVVKLAPKNGRNESSKVVLDDEQRPLHVK
jgi:uncharacterized membrane protein